MFSNMLLEIVGRGGKKRLSSSGLPGSPEQSFYDFFSMAKCCPNAAADKNLRAIR
jgi:hypothetical protein